MNQLVYLMEEYVKKQQLDELQGATITNIPGVYFFRLSKSSPRQPLLYQSGIIIMGQGRKEIHLGSQKVNYGPGDYLVIGMPLPLECEAIVEDDEQQLLGLSIDIKMPLLNELVSKLNRLDTMALSHNKQTLGLNVAQFDTNMDDAITRLMHILLNDNDAHILGNNIVTEIIYRVILGPQGSTLFGLVQQSSHYAKVANILNNVHENYEQRITVELLAAQANMSTSAFHRAFRQITMQSPMQYLKKVRLNKAKDLICYEGKRANDAARLVGYSSDSQFSREFKRHFKQSPAKFSSL